MEKRDTILLCPNPERDNRLELTKKVYDMLCEMGVKTAVCPVFRTYADYSFPIHGMKIEPVAERIGEASMMITFGGDGTILHAARMTAPKEIPILGVNMGTKGFMAELERDDLDLIAKAVRGDYTVDRRMMLDVTVWRGDKPIYSDFALNDVVIGGIAKIINLTVRGDGRLITEFSGDGLVVATPTGSTAYSMSAGGPIVEPDAENILITPICAHALIAKAFVLAPERCVTAKVGSLRGKQAFVSADGGASVNLESGDVIQVVKSKFVTNLISVSGISFYERVSEKLGERK